MIVDDDDDTCGTCTEVWIRDWQSLSWCANFSVYLPQSLPTEYQ
mgnify:CR=1 FL=1